MGKFKSKKNNMKAAAVVTDSVAADPNLVASDFEGLVAFEEITDYKITKSNEASLFTTVFNQYSFAAGVVLCVILVNLR